MPAWPGATPRAALTSSFVVDSLQVCKNQLEVGEGKKLELIKEVRIGSMRMGNEPFSFRSARDGSCKAQGSKS